MEIRTFEIYYKKALVAFFTHMQNWEARDQRWTEGRSSTAVAEDLRPTATAAEV